jgi:hypothetical protein
VLGLLRGTTFLKHGRRGFPHARLLWLDVTRAELGLRYGPVARGVANEDTEFFSLGVVLGVSRGRATPVLARVPPAREGSLFSLHTTTRTIDLEAPNHDAAELWAGVLTRLLGEPNLMQRALMAVVESGAWAPPA